MPTPADALDALSSVTGNRYNVLSMSQVRECVAQERARREETVRVLLGEIQTVQSIHNAVASVNTLPPELLAMVLSYLLCTTGLSADLVCATQVCNLWRNVALRTPTLWGTFALHNAECVRVLVSRSKQAPLSLVLAQGHTPTVQAVNLVASETHRIRSLRASLTESRSLHLLLSRLKTPAPILEELFVEKGQQFVPHSIVFPNLFAQDMPSLRHLTYRCLPLAFTPSSLVSLDIQGDHMTFPTASRILDVLERNPSLEKICLKSYLSSPRADAWPGVGQVRDRAVVSLPRLRLLDLYVYPPLVGATLLSRIAIPEAANIHMNGYIDIDQHFSDIIQPYTPQTSERLQCLRDLRRIELMWNEDTWDFRAFRKADEFIDPALHIEADSISAVPDARFLGNWAFDTSKVEVLVISSEAVTGMFPNPVEVDTPQWAVALRALPELKMLRVVGLQDIDAFNLLDNLDRKAQEVHCLKLKVLEIHGVEITDAMADVLVDIIVEREAAGYGLEEVALVNVHRAEWSPDHWLAMRETSVKFSIDEEAIDW